jgi:phage-related protein
MREIKFYRLPSGSSPVKDFLDSLPGKQAQKLIWVFRFIQEEERVPRTFFKKLVNTDDIWEIISKLGSIRILGFCQQHWLILTNGFIKKTKKTPTKEIKVAEERKRSYLQ